MTNSNIKIRRSKDRGHANHGWLDSYHTFSFGEYHDPRFMNFRSLRVINEDRVEAGMGFGAHPHRDMEILSYVVNGELKHQDSMNHSSVIKAGDVQKITAGTGITHSEFNPSSTHPVHFLQIWIIPKDRGLTPSYQERSLTRSSEQSLILFASSKPAGDVISFNQDVDIYRGQLSAGQGCDFAIRKTRGIWIQLIKGSLVVSGQTIEAGDGVAIEEQEAVSLKAQTDAEFLLFDLA